MSCKIVQAKKTKRWVVFKEVPEKKGKFGQWKIYGGFKRKSDAKKRAKELM